MSITRFSEVKNEEFGSSWAFSWTPNVVSVKIIEKSLESNEKKIEKRTKGE